MPQNKLAPPIQSSLAYSVPVPHEPGMLRPAPERFVLKRELENFSIGLGRGLTTGLEGTKQLLTQPVATARALVEAARQMGTDPGIVLEMLRAARQKAMSGSLGLGELIGENLTPGVRNRAPIKRDIFIGKKAKTWDAAAAARAEQMERAGASPEEIWQQTHTFRSPDGQWRQEISDESMALKKPFESRQISKEKNYPPPSAEPIEGLLSHPALMQAYPQVKNTQMLLHKQPEWYPEYYDSGLLRTKFSANPISFELDIRSKSEPGALDVTAHELQHAIQRIEGFQSGAATSDFSGVARKNLEANPKFQALSEMGKINAIDSLSFDMYKHAMGEAEARATEARRLMTAEQRRKTLPSKSYDVELNKLIRR